MYQLPDSPEKRALIEYLKQQIKICEKQQYINEGTVKEEGYIAVEAVYRDILKKIE